LLVKEAAGAALHFNEKFVVLAIASSVQLGSEQRVGDSGDGGGEKVASGEGH
jgi:hypothetical protein